MNYRYMLHPGEVVSRNDSQTHFISARDLMRLYKLKPSECLICAHCYGRKALACEKGSLIDLYPKFNGDYSLTPTKDNKEALK